MFIEIKKALFFTICIAVLFFSCRSDQTSFEDTVPNLHTLTTEVSPEESGTVHPSGGEFPAGEGIEIEARPAEGYVFDRWEDDLTGNSNPDSLFFTRNRKVTAHFTEREYPLNIEIIGEGSVNEEIAGESTEESIVSQYESSSLAAQNTDKDPGARSHRNMQVTTNGKLVQQNQTDESVEDSVQMQNEATGTSDTIAVTVKLTAEPAEGWSFARWEGDLTGSSNPVSIVVDEEKNVTAVFEEDDPEDITLSVVVEGEGTVEADPEQDTYNAGDEVTLTAVADSGWHFVEWQGDQTGNENPETIVMDGDKDITALFERSGASALEIIQQPSETVAGSTIDPAPEVELTDDQDNPIEGAEISVVLNENSFSSESTTTVATDENGVAAFDNLIVETADSGYRLSFETEEEDVSSINSDSFEVVAAAAEPSNSSAEVPDGAAGEETVITIMVNDTFGNAVGGAAGDLSVGISGANNASPSVSEMDAAGEYTATYTPDNAGTDQVEINLDGTPIDGSPYSSEITADEAEISGPNSSVSADPTELEIGENSTVTIELRDENDNEVEGKANSDFSIDLTGDAVAEDVTETSTAGTYEFQVTNDTAEEITVSVSVQGVTLDDTPTITFEAAGADDLEIVTQPGNSEAGQPIDGPPSVLVTDNTGNPVEGIEVSVSEQGGESFSGGTTTVTTGNNGIAEFGDLVITQAGSYALEFNVAGVGDVVSESFDVLAAAAADIEQVSGDDQTGIINEPLENAFVVRVMDEYGNPVEGYTVDYEIEEAPAGAAGYSLNPETTETDQSGESSTEFTLGDVAGTYVVTAISDVGNISFTAEAEDENDE